MDSGEYRPEALDWGGVFAVHRPDDEGHYAITGIDEPQAVYAATLLNAGTALEDVRVMIERVRCTECNDLIFEGAAEPGTGRCPGCAT